MTRGRKLIMALAIALPLTFAGASIAVAAAATPDVSAGDEVAIAPLAVLPLATGTSVPAACEGCLGNCATAEECEGLCERVCQELCTAECPGGGPGNCRVAGETGCARLNGSGGCGVFQTGNTATRSYGCGQRVRVQASTAPACASCDVVGLNEYPVNSPKYNASV